MKNLLLALGLFFCLNAIPALAQDNQPTIENKAKEFNSISRDRVLIELNYTGWYNDDSSFFGEDSVQMKWFNRGLNLYFMWDLILGDKEKSRFAFAPGLGISCHNVYMNARPTTVIDQETLTAGSVFVPITDNYRNNKIATTHIEVPLELRYRSKPDQFSRSFKVAVGLRLGYLWQKNYKYKGEISVPNIDPEEADNILSVKTKSLTIPGMSKYRFGPSLRIGYGNVSLVGFMSLNKLFEENRGPGLQPFSIGVTFNSF